MKTSIGSRNDRFDAFCKCTRNTLFRWAGVRFKCALSMRVPQIDEKTGRRAKLVLAAIGWFSLVFLSDVVDCRARVWNSFRRNIVMCLFLNGGSPPIRVEEIQYFVIFGQMAVEWTASPQKLGWSQNGADNNIQGPTGNGRCQCQHRWRRWLRFGGEKRKQSLLFWWWYHQEVQRLIHGCSLTRSSISTSSFSLTYSYHITRTLSPSSTSPSSFSRKVAPSRITLA